MYSDCTEKLRNRAKMNYYSVLKEARKNWVVAMKIYNIVVLKNLDAKS